MGVTDNQTRPTLHSDSSYTGSQYGFSPVCSSPAGPLGTPYGRNFGGDSPFPWGSGNPLLILGHWAHINLHAKWHLDPFSRFATIHRDRHTDTRTDTRPDVRIMAIAGLIGFAYSGQLKIIKICE